MDIFSSRLSRALPTAMLLVSLLFVVTILSRCHFGIDMTDEGYYLNWISNPWLFKFSNSQFGYIYYPLYRLVGENIVLLRQANMLIMLGLSWILCFKLLRYTLYDDRPSDCPRYHIYPVSFSMATCIFSFFGGWWWIPTPSYNSLALESVLIITLALLDLSMQRGRIIGWILLGIGGWLAFMAKPTAAIALGLLSALYLLIFSTQVKSLKLSRVVLSLLIVGGLLCLSAWLIDGSIHHFIMRLRHGVESQWLTFNGDAFRFLPKFSILSEGPARFVFILLMIVAFLATTASTPEAQKAQTYSLFFLLFICVLLCTNYYLIPLIPDTLTANLFLAIPLGSWLAQAMISHQPFFNKPTFKFSILAILFVLLPYACAIGTWDDIWIVMLRSAFFWMLAVVPCLARVNQPFFVRWRMVMPLVVGGQLLTISLVQLGMEHPYRQSQSLRTQTKPLEIKNSRGDSIGHLFVSDDDARYMQQLRRVAFSHGFSYGNSVIDLSGNYPAALYILGANPVGFPWVAPIFFGSKDVLAFALSQASCIQLARAWVLESLNGRYKFNLNVLESHGINKTTLSVINEHVEVKYNEKLQWLKPARPEKESISACEKMHDVQKQAQRIVNNMFKSTTPTSANIINRSEALINNRRLDQAIRLLKSALQIEPKNPIFYNNLCFAYALQQRYNDAMLACNAALELAPDYQLAKNNLVWIQSEM